MRSTDKVTGSVGGQGMARRGFLKRAALVAGVVALSGLAPGGVVDALAATPKAEKEQLKFGFIKLTDMAPLAIAYEKGYFEDEGLFVTLEAQANWKVLLDRVIDGELDGAHMLAGPAARRDHRLRHQGRRRHRLQHGPQRQRHHRLQRGLGGDEEASAAWRTASRCIRSRPSTSSRWSTSYKDAGQALQDGHGLPGLHAQLRTALLARGRRHPPGLLRPAKGDISGTDQRRRAALGDAAAADAGDAGGRHDRRLLRRRTVEPAGGVQGHRRAGRSPTTRSGRTTRRRCSASPRTGRTSNPNTHIARGQGADPRRPVARRGSMAEPHGGGEDHLAAELRRRRRRGDRATA